MAAASNSENSSMDLVNDGANSSNGNKLFIKIQAKDRSMKKLKVDKLYNVDPLGWSIKTEGSVVMITFKNEAVMTKSLDAFGKDKTVSVNIIVSNLVVKSARYIVHGFVIDLIPRLKIRSHFREMF